MSEISDEMLMAYADGELGQGDRVLVEAYLADAAEGPHRLAAFLSTGKVLAELFEQPMREPVPQRLIDGIRNTTARVADLDAQKSSAPVVDLRTVRRARSRAVPSWALAACFALLAAGAGTHWFLNQTGVGTGESYGLAGSDSGTKIAGNALASALETSPSGGSVALAIDGTSATVKPVFSFATATKGYCRQYEIDRTGTLSLGGVACRATGGQWRIEAQVPFAAAPAPDGKFVPAGKQSLAPIDAIVDRMISGDVLSPEDEKRLMSDGWRGTVP